MFFQSVLIRENLHTCDYDSTSVSAPGRHSDRLNLQSDFIFLNMANQNSTQMNCFPDEAFPRPFTKALILTYLHQKYLPWYALGSQSFDLQVSQFFQYDIQITHMLKIPPKFGPSSYFNNRFQLCCVVKEKLQYMAHKFGIYTLEGKGDLVDEPWLFYISHLDPFPNFAWSSLVVIKRLIS